MLLKKNSDGLLLMFCSIGIANWKVVSGVQVRGESGDGFGRG